MLEITSLSSHSIAAGNSSLWKAMLMATDAYGSTAKLLTELEPLWKEASQIYGKMGQALGAHLFELIHPNPLGEMRYPIPMTRKQSLH